MSKHWPVGEIIIVLTALFWMLVDIYILAVYPATDLVIFAVVAILFFTYPIFLLFNAYHRYQRRKVSWSGIFQRRYYTFNKWSSRYNPQPWHLVIKTDDDQGIDWRTSQWTLWLQLRGLQPGDRLVKDLGTIDPHIVK